MRIVATATCPSVCFSDRAAAATLVRAETNEDAGPVDTDIPSVRRNDGDANRLLATFSFH
jgi:hypothetical protein